MSWGEWVVGWLVLAVQVGAAAVAGNGLRRRLAPQTTGTPTAPVATAVGAVSLVVVTSLALGTIGLFTAWAVPLVLVASAVALDPDRRPWRAPAAGEPASEPSPEPVPEPDGADGEDADPAPAGDIDGGRPDPHANEGRFTRWAAWAAMAVLAAAWIDRVIAVYRRGLTDGDSLMYHLPFAARFVQRGWTTGTDPIGPDAWVAFYPANVELVQAWTMLPFDRDVVVPLMNLAWLGLALVAAWAIGAVTGRASVATAVVGVVLCLPILVATQGGTARVDIATIALVLSAIAMLLAVPRTPGSVAVAGMALGLAIGAKFALLPLAGTMLLAVAAMLWRRHSWRMSAVWVGGATLTAAYWYVRNWWVTGSPVPAVDLRLGGVGFAPLPSDRLALLEESSLVAHVGRPGILGEPRQGARRSVHGLTARRLRPRARRAGRRRPRGAPMALGRPPRRPGRGPGGLPGLSARAVQRTDRQRRDLQPDRPADRRPQRPLRPALARGAALPSPHRAGGPAPSHRRRAGGGGGHDDRAALAPQPLVRRGVADVDR